MKTQPQAVELGDRFLAKADANFLKRVLLGDVPKVAFKSHAKLSCHGLCHQAVTRGLLPAFPFME